MSAEIAQERVPATQRAGKFTGMVIKKETGDTLAGASILVKGTSTGTVSDWNGRFELSVIARPKAAK